LKSVSTSSVVQSGCIPPLSGGALGRRRTSLVASIWLCGTAFNFDMSASGTSGSEAVISCSRSFSFLHPIHKTLVSTNAKAATACSGVFTSIPPCLGQKITSNNAPCRHTFLWLSEVINTGTRNKEIENQKATRDYRLPSLPLNSHYPIGNQSPNTAKLPDSQKEETFLC
jgi:hypothetical protein